MAVEAPSICHDGERRNKLRVRFVDGMLLGFMAALPMITCEGMALERGLFDERLPMTAWSITMSKLGKQHIEEYWLPRWLKFLNKYCCMGIFSLEVGDKEEHLHIQGAVVINGVADCNTKAAFDRFLKYFLDIPAGTRDGEKGYKIQVKPCNKHSGQTIMYMVGYCLKQLRESHFRYVCKGFSPQDLQRACRAYARVKLDLYGGKTMITRKNMLCIIYKFWFKYIAPLPMDTSRILTYMLTQSTHVLCQTFVVSYGAHGIDRERLHSLWTLLTRPAEATKSLVLKTVFDENKRTRGGISGLHQRPSGRVGPPSTMNPGESDSDSDEFEDITFEEVRRKAMLQRDVPIRGPEDGRTAFEYPIGCLKAVHCGEMLSSINEVYLREHGFADNDGEAEELTTFQCAAENGPPEAGEEAAPGNGTDADGEDGEGDGEGDDEAQPTLKRLRKASTVYSDSD